MADKIKLVQGDNLPNIEVALTLKDGTPVDVSDADVFVHFRAAGDEIPLHSLACWNKTDGTDGRILFNFPGNSLQVEPGPYEGEIEIDFAGQKQSVYDVLKFNVRPQFA
jgi:hypothetical protein